MEVWRDKVAIVTGASAGIGAQISKDLARHGVIVVGLARRLDRLSALKEDILSRTPDAQFHGVQCDVTVPQDIQKALDYVSATFSDRGVSILINNAGVTGNRALLEPDTDDLIADIIQTNLISVIALTRKVYVMMKDKPGPGYIINMSSILGHMVPVVSSTSKPLFGVYPATKFALAGLGHVLRQELRYFGNKNIRITTISPGIVSTDIVRASGLPDKVIRNGLEPEDVAEAVMYVLSTPARVQIQDLIIRPTGEPY